MVLLAHGALAYIPVGYKYKDRRIYDIATDGGPKPALKMVYQFEKSDQYLGIMETTFVDAPAALDGEKVTAERDHLHDGELRRPGRTTSGGRRTACSTGSPTRSPILLDKAELVQDGRVDGGRHGACEVGVGHRR